MFFPRKESKSVASGNSGSCNQEMRILEIFTEILFPSLFLPGCVAASMHTHNSFSEVLLFDMHGFCPIPSEKQHFF